MPLNINLTIATMNMVSLLTMKSKTSQANLPANMAAIMPTTNSRYIYWCTNSILSETLSIMALVGSVYSFRFSSGAMVLSSSSASRSNYSRRASPGLNGRVGSSKAVPAGDTVSNRPGLVSIKHPKRMCRPRETERNCMLN